MRVVKGTSLVLASPTFVASDEETPTNATGTPTCSVTSADGSALAAAVVTQSDAGDLGNYQAAITTTHTAQLDRLAIVWTATVGGQTQIYRVAIEVVTARLAAIAQVRAMPGIQTTHSTATIRRVIGRLEDQCEEACGQAFSPRYERETFVGCGRDLFITRWLYPRTVRSVSFDATAQTVGNFTAEAAGIRADGRFTNAAAVVVEYEHGADSPRSDLTDQFLEAVVAEVLASVSKVKATTTTQLADGQGTYTYATTRNREHPTGHPGLDAVLRDIGLRPPGVARPSSSKP